MWKIGPVGPVFFRRMKEDFNAWSFTETMQILTLVTLLYLLMKPINPLMSSVIFLYPLKTSENLRFSFPKKSHSPRNQNEDNKTHI